MRQRAPRLALIIATVAGAAIAITAVATTGTSATSTTAKSVADVTVVSSSSPIASARQRTESDDAIRAYWTPARLRAAKQAPAPAAPSIQALEQTRAIPDSGAALTGEPTGGTGVTLSGQAERTSSPIVYSKIWTNHTKAPAMTTGKLFFHNQVDGHDYVCSGSVITSKGRDLVWTAGHCLYDGGNNTAAGWHTKLVFLPDFVGTESSQSWSSRGVFVGTSADSVLTPWYQSGNGAYDIGAFTVAPYKGHKLQDYVGAQGFKFKASHTLSIKDFGYPETLQPFTTAHPQGTPVDGWKLRYSTGTTWNATSNGAYIGFKTNLGHGASGGPWLTGINSGGYGYIVGINSIGGGIRMYSPYLGSQAIALYNAVNGK